MGPTHLYFAYGSNLHPLRLRSRVSSARWVATAALEGFRLGFDKRGQDGSAKCSVRRSERPGAEVLGAVFALAVREVVVLDEVEGEGYRKSEGRVRSPGGELAVFWYQAEKAWLDPALRPYQWYKDLVLAGARYHGFPQAYVESLERVDAARDPDHSRAERNLAQLRGEAGAPGA